MTRTETITETLPAADGFPAVTISFDMDVFEQSVAETTADLNGRVDAARQQAESRSVEEVVFRRPRNARRVSPGDSPDLAEIDAVLARLNVLRTLDNPGADAPALVGD